ncbi:hypothetical protein DPSP01_003438 [Paraphaeosphaeria sporulosa]
MTDPREEKRERKRVATRFPSLDGPYSLSRSPKGLHTSRPHSEMLGKSSYATSKKTRTQRGWLNGANVAGFDGSKDEERPLDCVARSSSPASGFKLFIRPPTVYAIEGRTIDMLP